MTSTSSNASTRTRATTRLPDCGTYDGNWRDEDRELFVSLVGEKLRSVGGRWNKGTWSSREFYDAYRKPGGKRKALRYPGRYLEGVIEKRDETAIDDWMIDQGLERVEQ